MIGRQLPWMKLYYIYLVLSDEDIFLILLFLFRNRRVFKRRRGMGVSLVRPAFGGGFAEALLPLRHEIGGCALNITGRKPVDDLGREFLEALRGDGNGGDEPESRGRLLSPIVCS